ncbi:MAG: SusC/RagA family TonB-linked outer membrane protein [Prevotella sp.]
MNKKILTACFLAMSTLRLLAQGTVVKGTVTDGTEPIIGATVKVNGSTTAAITDLDGNFVLSNVDPSKAEITVSYIGFQEYKLRLNGQTSLSVVMKENTNDLNDVVVIGYGTSKRGNVTGAMASVSGETLAKVPVANVAEAMQGKLPGVQITTSDGSPDAEVKILVRGGGSLTQDNSPLIIYDGMEVSSLNDIPPSDIESIDVLKDAASTAIYGARGANGVILITSKNAGKGRTTVSVNSYVQTKELANHLDVLDPYMYVRMQYENARQKSSNPSGFFNKFGHAYEQYIYQGYEGTDWQDEVFGTHPVTWYLDGTVTGTAKDVKYKMTWVHQNAPSVMHDNGLEQNNLNWQLGWKAAKLLSIDYRGRYLNKNVNGTGTDGVSLLSALRQAPTEGLDDFMTIPENNDYFDPSTLEEVTRFNPIEEAERNYRRRMTSTLTNQIALNWTILKGLTLRNEFSYMYSKTQDRRWWGVGTSNARSNGNQPYMSWAHGKSTRWQVTNTLTYHLDLGKQTHVFDFLLGQEMKSQASESYTDTYRYLPVDMGAKDAFDNKAGTHYTYTFSDPSDSRISSFFGRVNYSYKDRYLATVTLRADGSSKFAKGNRWGFFPAAALAWRISNEKFLHNNKVISNLKLRFSYGTSGNDRIDADLYRNLYGTSTTRPAGWDYTENSWYYRLYNTSYPVNKDVKWETTITRNIGLDFGFLNERISGSLDIYRNTVKDLLVASDIPGYSGFTKMMTNVGQTTNKGIELNVQGWIVDTPTWSLNATFNIGHNVNKIDKLASGETEWILSSGWAGNSLLNTDDYRAYVGSTTGLIYGYVNDGFYTIDDFEHFDSNARTWTLKDGVVDCSILSGTPRPGNAKFKKLVNDGTNVLTSSDRTVIGRTTPKASGGFGMNATWRNFDLGFFCNFMLGFDVYNANKITMVTWWNNSYNNLSGDMKNAWMNFDDMGNEIRYQPEILAEYNKNATMWNPTSIGAPIAMSYGIEDGSFLRLQTVTLGYSLPKSIIKKAHMTKCRFYFTGYNLFTITGYSGYDPEVDIATGLTPNIDYNKYPRSRSYTVGVQLQF